MKKYERGFTLIELVVVIIILGIFIAVAIPLYTDAISASKKTVRLANLKAIQKEIEAKYPKPEENQWVSYIEKEIGNIPLCPYSGKPFEMLTGTLDISDPENICKVAYHKINDQEYTLTSYNFWVGLLKKVPVYISHIAYQGPCKDEYITIRNYSENDVSLNRWKISNSQGASFIFRKNTVLPAFSSMSIPSYPRVYRPIGWWRQADWNAACNSNNPDGIWKDSGDTGTLYDNSGNIIDTYSY